MERGTVSRGVVSCLLLLLLALSGCAVLPRTVAVSEREQLKVQDAFRAMVKKQHACNCCLDAGVSLRFKSLFYSGSLDGYLQSMRPSFVKFIGISPMGQPLLMLSSDGRFFRFVNVPQSRGYEGSVGAKAFRKYAPHGLQPTNFFFWVTGRLPEGPFQVDQVEKDDEGHGYWLDLRYGQEGIRHLVLFDAEKGVILRHLLLDDRGGEQFEADYARYQEVPAGGGCFLPGEIAVKGKGNGNGTMLITLGDFLPDAHFKAVDFALDIPAGFENIIVQ